MYTDSLDVLIPVSLNCLVAGLRLRMHWDTMRVTVELTGRYTGLASCGKDEDEDGMRMR